MTLMTDVCMPNLPAIKGAPTSYMRCGRQEVANAFKRGENPYVFVDCKRNVSQRGIGIVKSQCGEGVTSPLAELFQMFDS